MLVCFRVCVFFKLTSFFVFAAKGRTNVELREQFTLAPGVSQAMTSFKTKAPKESPTSSVSGEGRNGMTGPITKVSNNI